MFGEKEKAEIENVNAIDKHGETSQISCLILVSQLINLILWSLVMQ